MLAAAMAVLAVLVGAAPQEGKAPASESDEAAARIKEFGDRFRTAVRDGDLDWVVASLDPTGFTCRDVWVARPAFAKQLRQKEGSYATVFDTAARRKQLEQAGVRDPESLSYRDWFGRCSKATVAIEDASGGVNLHVVVAWSAPGCPRGPRVKLRVDGVRLWISDLGDCV